MGRMLSSVTGTWKAQQRVHVNSHSEAPVQSRAGEDGTPQDEGCRPEARDGCCVGRLGGQCLNLGGGGKGERGTVMM